MSKTRPLKYRLDIDGLRAFAVLAVIMYHLNSRWMPGGFAGVDVFLVISGYLVTGSMAASQAKTLGSFLAEFYAKRLARILPALVAALVVTSLAATMFIPKTWFTGTGESTATYAFFGLSNWFLQSNQDGYFSRPAELNPFIHTWSLGVEEQFYLIAPVLVYLWLASARRPDKTLHFWAKAAWILLTAASVALCAHGTGKSSNAAYYSLISRFWEITAGALLFLASQKKNAWVDNPTVGTALAWLGVACLGVSLVSADQLHFPWPWAILSVLGTACLIVSRSSTWPRKALSTGPAVWIGKRAYSVYLWHWPVFVLMRWTCGLQSGLCRVIALFLTFALAAFSYRWIESSTRRNPWVESNPVSMRIAGFLALSALGCLSASYFFGHPALYGLSAASRNPDEWQSYRFQMPRFGADPRRCDVEIDSKNASSTGYYEDIYRPVRCHDAVFQKRIYVIGDSHAMMLRPDFEQLSAELGVQAIIRSMPGCPYLDLALPRSLQSLACRDLIWMSVDKTLREARPGDIVLLPSLRMNRWVDDAAKLATGDMRERMYGDEHRAMRAAAFDEAKRELGKFAAKSLRVIFFAPPPLFKAPPYRCSDWFNKANPFCSEGSVQPRAELEALRTPLLKEMKSLSRIYPDVSIWDPFPPLCPGASCSAERDHHPLFFDDAHLAAYGAWVIYPSLKNTIISLYPAATSQLHAPVHFLQ